MIKYLILLIVVFHRFLIYSILSLGDIIFWNGFFYVTKDLWWLFYIEYTPIEFSQDDSFSFGWTVGSLFKSFGYAHYLLGVPL